MREPVKESERVDTGFWVNGPSIFVVVINREAVELEKVKEKVHRCPLVSFRGILILAGSGKNGVGDPHHMKPIQN